METTANATQTRGEPARKKSTAYARETFPVLEMTCAACAASVESMLKATPGVRDAGVNFASQTAWVEFDQRQTSPADLQKSVQSIGYDLVLNAGGSDAAEQTQRLRYRSMKNSAIWSFILALPVIVLGMFYMDDRFSHIASMLLTAPVVIYFGRHFFIHAWKQARHGKANMDTLVALSSGIAFLFSLFNTLFPQFWWSRGMTAHVYYEASAGIIAFISLGKVLEEKARYGTSSAIRRLMGMQPKMVSVISGEEEHQIPLADVKTGHTILIRAGEKIPVDGVVTHGESYVDESMISGEPVPVAKSPGKKVFAGTVNQQGSFRFRAEKVGRETLLGQIIEMVRRAQDSKAPVQRLADKVAGIFVPVVMGISALTFVTWMIAGGADAFSHALLTSLTVLVIACPCALGLATPTAIMVGIGKGAENNILIKDAESLEVAQRVNTVVLDKTGTITEGRPAVTDLTWVVPDDAVSKYRDILFALESRSMHPLATAVVQRLKEEGAKNIALDSFESLNARGVTGSLDGHDYAVGNQRMLNEVSRITLSHALQAQCSALQSQAKTVIFFIDNSKLVAIIAIADKIKVTAKAAIASLKEKGIEIYMLTGDNEQTAKAVARQVGISHYQAEMLPAGKAEFVSALQQRGNVVAMVGDGINDSQALVQSDVSIAIGRGSDVAMDVAKMTLITSDLRAIPKALALSRKTVSGIRQNLFWAFIYNLIGIPLAAGVLYPINGFLLNPMVAAAAMALSSVSVVGNSLRLKFAGI